MPILVFLGLSVLELGSIYAIDRQTDRRQTKASLNASALWGRRHNKRCVDIANHNVHKWLIRYCTLNEFKRNSLFSGVITQSEIVRGYSLSSVPHAWRNVPDCHVPLTLASVEPLTLTGSCTGP